MKRWKPGGISAFSKIRNFACGLRKGRYASRTGLALVFVCLWLFAALDVITWIKDHYMPQRGSVRRSSRCIDPLWCSAETISINNLLQLQSDIYRKSRIHPLDLDPVPLPSLELMNSIVGRDIEVEKENSTDIRPWREMQTFLVADIAVEVSPYAPALSKEDDLDRSESNAGALFLERPSVENRKPELCTPHTNVLLVVTSAWNNFEKRATIRSSWANLTDVRRMFPKTSVVFLIASPKTTDDTRIFRSEAALFRDSIFLNMTDNYRNLTYKVLSGYQWALKNCPAVEIIGKVDDDIFLDVWGTLRAIHRYVRVGEMAILGTRTPDDSIVRTQGHVHCVDSTAYADTAYPYSMRGMAYYVTKSYAAIVLAATFGRKPLGLDDKYITGIWARKLGARQIFLNSPEGDYAMNCDALSKWISDEGNEVPLPLASLCVDPTIHYKALQKATNLLLAPEGNDRIFNVLAKHRTEEHKPEVNHLTIGS